MRVIIKLSVQETMARTNAIRLNPDAFVDAETHKLAEEIFQGPGAGHIEGVDLELACGRFVRTFVGDLSAVDPCPHCGRGRQRSNEHLPVTCGKSECQEAEFHANQARNSRKSRSYRRI